MLINFSSLFPLSLFFLLFSLLSSLPYNPRHVVSLRFYVSLCLSLFLHFILTLSLSLRVLPFFDILSVPRVFPSIFLSTLPFTKMSVSLKTPQTVMID
jgi:hypothetical protein